MKSSTILNLVDNLTNASISYIGILALAIIILIASLAVYPQTRTIQPIVRNGPNLELGLTGQRFRFLGGNHFNLLVKYIYGEFYGQTGGEIFDISSQYNISVIRFWATCSDSYFSNQCLYSLDGSWNKSKESFFSKFDELVADAERHHIYIIPVLSDGYDAFTNAAGGQVCQVGSGANLEYKRFVRDVVSRYKDRSIILAWEIGNEGASHCSSFNDLIMWYRDSAKYIRGIDQTHLISTGENNFGSLDISNFFTVNSQPDIGASSVHIYDRDLYNIENNSTYKAVLGFVSHWTDASHDLLGMPIYFGEFGTYDVANGSDYYGNFIRAGYESNADGMMLWSWLDGEECSTPASSGGSCITPERTPLVAQQVGYWGGIFKSSDTIEGKTIAIRLVAMLIIPVVIVAAVIVRAIVDRKSRKREF
jgi:endo-1,4-beta-mannosidase